MVAKAWGAQRGAGDELSFRNDSVSLCMTVNRRARTMRVVDFRAGATDAKRLFVLSIARREGVAKIYTLVERDEVATWVKLGFAREGTVPSFYKRSDAFILGAVVPPVDRAKALAPPVVLGDDGLPSQSGIRPAVHDGPAPAVPVSPAHALMERTLVAAKKTAKDLAERALPHVKLTPTTEADARKAIAAAVKSGKALTGFEPFGRDAERRYFVASTRGGFELHASVESQACFSNAFLELLVSPRTEAEKLATAGVVRAFCERLLREEVVSFFSLAPSDDLALAEVFLVNGFRRTGLLLGHLQVGSARKDAILWTRKLVLPTED